MIPPRGGGAKSKNDYFSQKMIISYDFAALKALHKFSKEIFEKFVYKNAIKMLLGFFFRKVTNFGFSKSKSDQTLGNLPSRNRSLIFTLTVEIHLR